MGVVFTTDGKRLDTLRIREGRPVLVPCRADEIEAVLDPSRRPMERCLAARSLSPAVLRLFFGRSTVLNMRAVARRLCPVLVDRALNTPGISLRMLVHVAYGRTPEEQIERWNDYLLRAKEDKRPEGNPRLK